MRLDPSSTKPSTPTKKSAEEIAKEQVTDVARARVQIHYIRHLCFVNGEDLLNAAKKLSHIPTVIVQGRYDMVCPPQTAWLLSRAMPHAEHYVIQDAGHSATEPGVTSALIGATEQFKAL